MEFREIGDYSLQAVGAGCFFGGGAVKRTVNDVGGRRPERIFSTNIRLDYDEVGTVEFSETAAIEIASILGWIAPEMHEDRSDELLLMSGSLSELDTEITDLEERNAALMKQLIAQQVQITDLEDEATDTVANNLSLLHEVSDLTDTVNYLNGELEARDEDG